ncbi:MAG: EamA family transporter, partial [Eubacteriales bacterium]|nr:EamA family transporter [Eubacteriales bacterium]
MFSDRTLNERQSELLMAAVVIARSTSFVFSKLTVASMSPFNILAVRFLTAFAILLALFGGRLRGC